MALTDMLRLTDRDRAVLLALSATVLSPLSLLAQVLFPGVSPRRVRRRLAELERLGLLVREPIGPGSLALPRGTMLLSLTSTGWRLAQDLGAPEPPDWLLRQSAALPSAAASVAEAWYQVRGEIESGAVEWALAPNLSGGPEHAWAILSFGGRTLVYDLDLPGRSLAQVRDRIRIWGRAVAQSPGLQLCYVIPVAARRERLRAALSPLPQWLTFAAPGAAARRFLADTHRGIDGKLPDSS